MDFKTELLERKIYGLICRSEGIKAKDIALKLGQERKTVNHYLFTSPLMKELCYQDRDYRWHGLIRQTMPHYGLEEFAGCCGTVREFLAMSEEQWLYRLKAGCMRIGRNLNDTRGLIHSFLDTRDTMVGLFADLEQLMGKAYLDWEIAFELRIKKSRHIRIYADVLLITENRVFAMEFKMKDVIEPEEVRQAAKYCPFLEIIFGEEYEVLPVLVLTKTMDLFRFVPIGQGETSLPVCSGDMPFNALNEYLGFLQE